jgi:sensor histidine kinase YesM
MNKTKIEKLFLNVVGGIFIIFIIWLSYILGSYFINNTHIKFIFFNYVIPWVFPAAVGLSIIWGALKIIFDLIVPKIFPDKKDQKVD